MKIGSSGPWRYEIMDNRYGYAVMSGNRFICSVAARGAGIKGISAKAKADADCISRVPTMVEFINQIASMSLDSDEGVIDQSHEDDGEIIEKLIAKAREISA